MTGFAKEREEPSFTDFSQGVSASFDHAWTKFGNARLGYSFEARNGRDLDASLDTTVIDDFVVAKVFGELSYDRRDSPIFPERGHREVLRYELAQDAFGSEIEYSRLTFSGAFHVPLEMLGKHWALSFGVRSGIIWNLDQGELPVQERFYTGGEATVRSFKESELGPRTSLGKPRGGEYYNVLNAELRFPIYRAFEGAAFADAGNVGNSASDFGLSKLRYAIGGGLRLRLPIGPIRLDAGFNPDAESFEDDYAIHVSVGLPF